MAPACLVLFLLSVLTPGCASKAASDEAELILRAVPETLKPGESGAIEVRVLPARALAAARLSARSSDPGLGVEPPTQAIGDLAPVRLPASQAQSPPNPPALGVVPVRIFTLKAIRPGTYQVTVELVAGDASVARMIQIGVKE